MDELINQISEKTGIPHDTAKQAVNMVIGFLKQKLPAPIGSQIDRVLGTQVTGDGGNQAQETTGGLGQILGNLFGKKDQ
jgi:hypothetical protein